MDRRIDSIVRGVILEYCGVSDDIIESSEEVLSLLLNTHRDFKWFRSSKFKYIDGNEGYVKQFTLDIPDDSKAKYLIDSVSVIFYGYSSEDISFDRMLDYISELGLYHISFSYSTSSITLRIPFPYIGSIDKFGNEFLLSSLNHELKHALSSRYRDINYVSNAYANSLSKNGFSKSDNNTVYLMKAYIKKCYYIFDLDEIDARLQEIYVQLKQGYNLEKCEPYLRIENAREGYDYLFNLMYGKEDSLYYSKYKKMFQSVLTEVLGEGITERQFFKYCERGIRRYKEHLKRILGRWQQEQGNYKGSFKQYASNEIPQEYNFNVRKPSFWRKISKKLKKL